jgi:hypothetical protein
VPLMAGGKPGTGFVCVSSEDPPRILSVMFSSGIAAKEPKPLRSHRFSSLPGKIANSDLDGLQT